MIFNGASSKTGFQTLWRNLHVLLLAVAMMFVTPNMASADVSGTVSYITVRFQPADHSKMPTPSQVGNTSVSLMQEGSTLYAKADAPSDAKPITMDVKQIRGHQLSEGAVNAIQQAVVKKVNDRGIGSVAVRLKAPRGGQTGGAEVQVVAGTVASVKAKAADEDGDRPKSADNIEKWSPVQTDGDEPALLSVEEVNEYLAYLNRFPGRSVTASISAGENPGSILLDYLVTREQTFNLWAQVSNTGTEGTSKWIEQFGLFLTQVSGNDDILSISGMTGNFQDNTRSINGYYDSRLGDSKDLRWRITGNWGDYTSEDVGFQNQDFTGSTWAVQGDLIWNMYQNDAFFIDLVPGFRYWNSEAKNVFFGVPLAEGKSNFYTPTVSLNFFEVKPHSSMNASVGFEYTSATGDQTQMNELGRQGGSTDWFTLFASGHTSVFIDQLFAKDEAGSSTMNPMVHEITVRGQGQYAFNDRLTPLSMSAMGGYYTVRGYPQSIVAGDNSVQGTVEYRLHLPRTFEPQPVGKGLFDDDFRWAPDAATGALPDWDLALLGFFDIARVWQSDRQSYEKDTTLMGAGVGVELAFRQNFKFTVNYGWALKEVTTVGQQGARVDSGNGQFYFLGSLSF